MPIDDFLADLAMAGSDGKGWRGWIAILFALLGAVAGGYLGWQWSALVGALGGVPLGAFVGWFIGVLFNGLLRILLLMLVFGVIVAAWFWLTGGAA